MIIAVFVFGWNVLLGVSSFAEMTGNDYILSPSVMDSTGKEKGSNNFLLLDSVGQPTPIGPSQGNDFILEAGFIYQLQFTITLDNAITNAIGGLTDLLDTQGLTNQQIKKIESAIQFLQQALASFAQYQAGDLAALANALNKTKSAINKMLASGLNATDVYQKMLAQAAELNVTSEVNRIALMAGETDPNVVQARVFLLDGSNELLGLVFDASVQSFTQAYNQALLAI